MKVTEVETKESTKRLCGGGCLQRDSAEHEEYAEALIGKRMTENNTTNADRRVGGLLEEIVSARNLNRAYKRVKKNKGAGGVDGMSVDELLQYLKDNGGEIRETIKAWNYKPQPVRRVEIPKDNGKTRKLGIPTAVDRVIQQAVAQVLTPIYEPKFVETSYGFRPRRSAHQALRKSLEYLREGYVWTVDMDLGDLAEKVAAALGSSGSSDTGGGSSTKGTQASVLKNLSESDAIIAITKNISSNRKSGTSFYNRQQIQT